MWPDLPQPNAGSGRGYFTTLLEPPDEYFQNHESERRGKAASFLLGRAEELIKGKGRLLDVGSRRGEFLKAALDAGWQPVGIEPSEAFAKHAEKYSGVVVRRESIEQCNFENDRIRRHQKVLPTRTIFWRR